MATAPPSPPDAATAGTPPNGDILYEVVDGNILEKPRMGAFQGQIASLLVGSLVPFVRTHSLGKVVSEVLFRLNSATNLQRRPAVAFVSRERWALERRAPDENAWDVVPDLAVEVVSPTNTAYEIVARIREYLDAGVRQVWVIYPNVPLVYIYESETSIRVLKADETLDGGALLPGFRMAVATLFDDTAE